MKTSVNSTITAAALMLAICIPAKGQFSKALKDIKKKASDVTATQAATAKPNNASTPSTSAGKTYHVALTGSNRNDGSKQKPVKDIQKAIDLAQNGDKIHIAEGAYLGKLDQGFIEINNKYISLIAGWNADFSEHNPAKYVTSIRPGVAQAGTCGSRGTIHIMAKGSPSAEIVIDGFALDRGEINVYLQPNPSNPVTSTPNDKFETGRLIFWGESPTAPKMGGLTFGEPIIRFDVEGSITIRNCVIVNSPMYGIMGAIRPTGKAVVSNNIFVANAFAACQIVGNSVKQDQCSVDFHHNTVLFSWCRNKVMEDMGYGYRFMTGLHQRVHNNIFGGSNLGAIDRGPIDSNKAIEEKRETSAYDNIFFMNKADLVLPSGGGKWLMIAAEQFEDADQIDKYEGNRQLPESEKTFVEAINQDYLRAFATISSTNSSNYNPNSAANAVNRLFGMNQQGTETVRPTMFANRYPYADAFKLWGTVQDYGAQAPK